MAPSELEPIGCNDNLLWNASDVDRATHTDAEESTTGRFSDCYSMTVEGKNPYLGLDTSDYAVKLAALTASGPREGRRDVVLITGLTMDYDSYGTLCDHLISVHSDDVYRCWVVGHPGAGGSDTFQTDAGEAAVIGDIDTADLANAILQQFDAIRDYDGLLTGELLLIGYSRGGQIIPRLQDIAVMAGGSLADTYGITDVLTIAPMPIAETPWAYGTGPLKTARLYKKLVIDANLASEIHPATGTIAEFDNNRDFVDIWWADRDDPTGQTAYGSQPDDASLTSMNSVESLAAAAQVLGVLGQTRVSVDARWDSEPLFPPADYALTTVYGTHDTYVTASDATALFKYATGTDCTADHCFAADASHGSLLVDVGELEPSLQAFIGY